ncbi:MAG: SMR family transporter, partial [Paracoccaceae bacterium]
MNPWLLVLIAGLMETGWAIGLKYSDGLTKPVAAALTLLGAAASF